MKEIILGCWLGIQAGFDFKYKEIPIWFSVMGGGLGMVFCFLERREILDVVLACLPGLCALVFAWLSKETMGYGDGIVLMVMGVFLPISHLLSIGMVAFFIAGVVALCLLVFFQKNGSYRIPLVPFLGFAYGCDWLVRLGEL